MPRKIRDYKDEYKQYQSKPDQLKNRAQRNAARAAAVKAGKVSKGDKKDVDHKTPISKGGGNGKGNTRVISVSSNRSFKRNSKGGIK
jgi:hypothetical protein